MAQSFEKALLLYRQHRYDAAIQAIMSQLAHEPENADLHALWGMCLARLKHFDDAQAKANEAVSLAPDMSYAHYARAVVLSIVAGHYGAVTMNRKLKEALESVEHAIAIDPLDADFHYIRAALLWGLDRKSDAHGAIESALKFDPQHAPSLVLRAEILLEQGKVEQALQLSSQALAEDPENGDAHCCHGRALLRRGEVVEAKVHLQEALRLDPDSEQARVGMIEAIKSDSHIYRVLVRPQEKWLTIDHTRRIQIIASLTALLFVLLAAAIFLQLSFLIAGVVGLVAIVVIGWFASKLAMDAAFHMNATQDDRWRFVQEEERSEWQFAVLTVLFLAVGGVVWLIARNQLSVAAGASIAFSVVPWIAGRMLRKPGLKIVGRSAAALTASCGLGAFASSFWFPVGAMFLMILSATVAGIASLTMFAAANRRV